ncbi:hypothetical protein CHS0354_029639 [Potamilus streckersoni]|uniref:Uncharacterized protein n=1 Tax=Potamilus streckersoni TaxID=2493646 RepID=A0AAE0VIZ0_9BIVA|nr:hypothetical protein CHS0354_029639 [Potamilus streckersoni]
MSTNQPEYSISAVNLDAACQQISLNTAYQQSTWTRHVNKSARIQHISSQPGRGTSTNQPEYSTSAVNLDAACQQISLGYFAFLEKDVSDLNDWKFCCKRHYFN